MTYVVIAIAQLLSWGASLNFGAEPESTDDPQLAHWTALAAGGELAGVLRGLDSTAAFGWPRVVSSTYASELPEAERSRQEQFRRVAAELLELVDRGRQPFETMPANERLDSIVGLLRLRNKVVEHRSYVNLLLADALNRVAYAELSKSLLSDRKITPKHRDCLRELTGYTLDVGELWTLAEEERGGPISGKDPGTDQHGSFTKLMGALNGGVDAAMVAPLADPSAFGTYELLNKPDFGKLLIRHWMTDYKTHISLPLLALYVERKPDLSAADSYEEVERMLPLTDEVRQSIGSPLNRARATALSDLHSLLRSVGDGSIDVFVGFDLSRSAAVRTRAASLSVAIAVPTKNVRLYEPLRVNMEIHNPGSAEVTVADPLSMEVRHGKARRSPLTLLLRHGTDKSREAMVLRPPIGNLPDATITPLALAAGATWKGTFHVSADWLANEPKPLLSEPGAWSLGVRYDPSWEIDDAPARHSANQGLASNAVPIGVSGLGTVDGDCWNHIRKCRHWMVLYDATASAIGRLSPSEVRRVEEEMGGACSGSPSPVFRPYLDWIKVLCETAPHRSESERKPLNRSLLQPLAATTSFPYREQAAEMLKAGSD